MGTDLFSKNKSVFIFALILIASRDYCMRMKLICRRFLKLYGLNSVFENALLFKRSSGARGVQFIKNQIIMRMCCT